MRRTLYIVVLSAALAIACVFEFSSPERPSLITGPSAPPPADNRVLSREIVQMRRSLNRLVPDRPFIVINTHDNTVSLCTKDSALLTARCSTGSGNVLQDSVSGRSWKFATPHGVFRVANKLEQPWWRKPDWAYIEENEPLPGNDQERLDPTTLGEYAIGFGDGYYIHGTLYERLLGISVTHGCVRLGSEDLKRLFDRVRIGDRIYVF